MLTRHPDWATRLEVFLRENAERRFQYGDWDCCLFVCAAIEAMTGVDPARELRGKYGSRTEAKKAMTALCGSPSVRAAVETVAGVEGLPEVEPWKAQRGDVVLLRRSNDYSLGLVSLNGQDVLVLGQPTGLSVAVWQGTGIVKIPRSAALVVKAWKV